MALGAAGQQGEINFDAWRLNLAEAVAKAGGLVDVQADPGSVFLYRLEPRELATLLGIDVTKFKGELIPVIFSISFREPGNFFLATSFQMRSQDIVFIANANSVEVTKFLDYLNTIMATANNGIILTSNGIALRNTIRALR